MEWFRTNILSKVDDSKIYLKSINISQDIYAKLKKERRPHFYIQFERNLDTLEEK